MPTTTNLALPYPADGDTPDGPAAFGSLANGIDDLYGAWNTSAWTPTITQSGSVTFTNNRAALRKRGRDLEGMFKFTITGSGTGGNKVVIGGLPYASVVAGFLLVGECTIRDESATTDYRGGLYLDSGSTTNLVLRLAGGLAGAATFTAGLANTPDVIYGRFKLETAA